MGGAAQEDAGESTCRRATIVTEVNKDIIAKSGENLPYYYAPADCHEIGRGGQSQSFHGVEMTTKNQDLHSGGEICINNKVQLQELSSSNIKQNIRSE